MIQLFDVKRHCAIFYGRTREDMECPSRQRRLARPRQIAMALTRHYFGTRASYPRIGKMFGGRDHTTVLHAVRRIEQLAKDDPAFARELSLICGQIEAGAITLDKMEAELDQVDRFAMNPDEEFLFRAAMESRRTDPQVTRPLPAAPLLLAPPKLEAAE